MRSVIVIRVEAAEILKEILVSCGNIEGKSIKLMPPDADSILSKGYHILIYKSKSELENSCIKRIAKNHLLIMHEEENFLVLYKPL
jgi:hypothetical protein